jgi:mannose-6-phosphate isomerase-like protein (cupin superfamily)
MENVKEMEPKIVKANSLNQYLTPEHCFITENFSGNRVSIARARVQAGVTTVPHHLKGIDEIYIVTSGVGRVTVGNLKPADVGVGDVVVIPAGTSQMITNTGKIDLVFYCVCTPRFTADRYCDEEAAKHGE